MARHLNMKKKHTDHVIGLHQLPGQLLINEDLECEHWYDGFPKWPEQSTDGPRRTVAQWSDIAENALASASKMYDRRMRTSSGSAMSRALGKEKTLSDKIAAITLLVQESPIHHLDELHALLSFSQKKNRRERAPAIEAIKDLLINDLLPNDRRLSFFHDRTFSCAKGRISKRHMIYAMFESKLKSVYREYLQVLEESGSDSLAFFKEKVVKIVYELLVAKPENEKYLLAMLVNKLGDPDRKVSSSASYSLLRLIEKDHPQMRLIVVREVERLLLRPHLTRRTQYYSVCFLNQIRFGDEDAELARQFVRIYMDLFIICLEQERATEREAGDKKRKEKSKRVRKQRKLKRDGASKQPGCAEAKETKLMGALLIGINRAFPYTMPERDETSYDKYYNSLFHVAHAKSLGPSTHALAFLFQVSQSNSIQSNRFYRALYSRVYDAADCSEMTQAAFLNLVYKAMKADTNTRRVKAFVKRLMQAACQSTPGFAAACAVVISQTCAQSARGILRSFISLTEKDDEDEEFRDLDDKLESSESDSNSTDVSSEREQGIAVGQMLTSSPTPSSNRASHAGSFTQKIDRATYDPRKRDPEHAGADRSSLWEAVTLTSHYHPSVSLFAKKICSEMQPVSYTSDPLKDFSQIAFLDRFSYKKAKNRVAKSLYGKRSVRYRDSPLANSEEFQELVRAGNVAQDDMFFVRFFSVNPDRVQRGNAREVGVLRETYGSDVDSEEEVFEEAMKAELSRLGKENRFFTYSRKGFAGDVDEEDEDEIQAFEKAFKNDMLKCDEEAEDDDMDEGTYQKGDINDLVNADDRDEESDHVDARKVTDETAVPSSNVFAAAEDYAEAIEKEHHVIAKEQNLGLQHKRDNPSLEADRSVKDYEITASKSVVKGPPNDSKRGAHSGQENKPPCSLKRHGKRRRTVSINKKRIADRKATLLEYQHHKKRKL